MNQQMILVENGLVEIKKSDDRLSQDVLATVLSNIAYYGYALTETAYAQLVYVENIESWWAKLEKTFKSLTGADKNMGDFVVYKNFPREVLEMSQAEYWLKQILMYWGFPNEYFTEDEQPREKANEKLPLKVLHPADDNSLSNILSSLLRSQVRWTDRQRETVQELLSVVTDSLDLSKVSFKENMVELALMLVDRHVSVKSATDVLRLAVGMSDGDISLRTNSKFRRFKRRERRFLLSLLEGCGNLNEDVARRSEMFKRLFFGLRPGDYDQYPKVSHAYDIAYRGLKVPTFNSEIERLLAQSNPEALDLLKTRPGDFLRRLRVATNLYGQDAVDAFQSVMNKLSVHQLVKIKRHLLTANDRLYRVFPPKGNWGKLQVAQSSNKDNWDESLALQLAELIESEVSKRVKKVIPAVKLDPGVEKVKLQGNDANLSPYGRGTVFDIPENITFLRSASYWKKSVDHNIWYDNSWNFFNSGWGSVGACCWEANRYGNDAIFSGDPTNSKELKGRACQMIDLYLDKLKAQGVRYAVWSLLCYSHLSFNQSDEVYASLQWGEHPQKNKIFEPSRNVLSFPVRGDNLTKFIAYVDIEKRQLIYMDANLRGDVYSAQANCVTLSKTMPAFVEYLDSLPSVYDLFKNVNDSEDGMPVVYEDTDVPIESERAYVFLQRNKNSVFDQFDLNTLLET